MNSLLENKVINIYVLNIEKFISDDKLIILLNYVNKDKRTRILKYHHKEDSQRCLFGDLLARYMIFKRIGIKMSEIVFKYNEFMKPYIDYENVYFNISHSENVILGIIDENQVGVDVEKIADINIKIAEQFFSINEINYIYKNPNMKKSFYDIWTRKESFIKAIGTGLNTSLDSFDASENVIKFNGYYYYLNNINIFKEYVGAVCSRGKETIYNIINISILDFIDEIENMNFHNID